MTSVVATRSNDVDEFRDALRPASREYLVTGRGAFAGTVTKIDLPRLWMQRIDEALPRTWCGPITRNAIFFHAVAGAPMVSQGVAVASDEIGVVAPGVLRWHAISAASSMAGMSVAASDLMMLGPALVGRDLHISRDSVSVEALPETVSRLRRIHGAAIQLAATAPEIIANDDAARGLESALIEAFIDCLSVGRARIDTAAHRRHTAILARFHRFAEDHSDEPLYLIDVCAAIGVTERTLTLCCQEQLGISPKRFLMLRRMHLAHRALRTATPLTSSVTEIATRFGFWELGRFAVGYRAIFGEAPSSTLRNGVSEVGRG